MPSLKDWTTATDQEVLDEFKRMSPALVVKQQLKAQLIALSREKPVSAQHAGNIRKKIDQCLNYWLRIRGQ